MRVSDPRVALAAIRAAGALERGRVSSEVLARAGEVAERMGRSVVECEAQCPHPLSDSPRVRDLVGAVALGWSDALVPEEVCTFPFAQLNITQALVFAVCLALAWPDMHHPPYPGVGFERAVALDALGDMGVDSKRGKAALDGELPMMMLLVTQGTLLRLGPAVAVLPATFVEAMRRFHGRLPGREYAEPGGGQA